MTYKLCLRICHQVTTWTAYAASVLKRRRVCLSARPSVAWVKARRLSLAGFIAENPHYLVRTIVLILETFGGSSDHGVQLGAHALDVLILTDNGECDAA